MNVVPIEVLSDIAKIGIPSVVALAGTAAAVLIARAANRHAQVVERERHRFTLMRDEETRRADLLKAAAVEVTRLHHYLVAYNSVLFAKTENLSAQEEWPATEKELENDSYRELLAAFHSHLQTRAHILLLAQRELTERHRIYLEQVSIALDIQIDRKNYNDALVENLIDQSLQAHEQLMELMSQLYFPLHAEEHLQGKKDVGKTAQVRS